MPWTLVVSRTSLAKIPPELANPSKLSYSARSAMRTKETSTFSSTIRALWFAAVLLLTVSCGSKTHAKLPYGTVDTPPLGQQVGLKGMASFVGWAIGENGISDVAIYVDRVYVVSAQLGLVRPDVAAAFPKETAARTAGWQASFDCTNIPAGPHEVVVQATATNGARRDLGVFQVVVLNVDGSK